MRAQCNRLVVASSLLAGLPVVVAAERLRPGSGRRVARAVVRTVSRWCGVRVSVLGWDRLDPEASYVLVPNHSSLLDVPAVLLADEHARFLAAAELFGIPLLSGAMRAIGTERVDRRDPRAASRQLARLAAAAPHGHLVIFAQGGIARPERPLSFRGGAFALAIAAGRPVVPVAIHGTARALPPGARLAVRPGDVTVELLTPVPTAGLGPRDRRDLRRRVEQSVSAALDAGSPRHGAAGAGGQGPPARLATEADRSPEAPPGR